MQQKSTQKILLFSVAAQKVEKIKALCKTLEKKERFSGGASVFQVLIHHKWIFLRRNIRRQVSNQSDVRLS